MNRLPLVVSLLLVASAVAAQSNLLVAVEHIPIVGSDERAVGIVFPTACDQQGRAYVKLSWAEPGNVEPLLRLSDKGAVEVQFDTSGELINRYAVRPDGGVVMMHSDGKDKFLDNFAPDGKHESSVRLEPPPTPFFPSQLAVFHSGEIFISGQQYHPGYKASAAIYSATGSLIRQPILDDDKKGEQEIATDSGAQKLNAKAVDRSVATAGDDGLVYLMRPTTPAVVYAILPAGDVLRTLRVTAPVGAGIPWFGLRVVKNRLLIQFRRDCAPNVSSCIGSIYAVLDATTGKRLATYQTDKEAVGAIACYVPDTDRFFIFSLSSDRHGWAIVEARAKAGSP
jgi:hypothetical protein